MPDDKKRQQPKAVDKSTKKRKTVTNRRRRTRLLALEPRVLFDGALAIDIAQNASESPAASASPDPDAVSIDGIIAPAAQASTTTTEVQRDRGTALPELATSIPQPLLSRMSGGESDAEGDATADVADVGVESRPYASSEVLFIDSTLWNAEQLAAAAQDNIEVHMLQPDEDGVAQISDVLAGKQGVTAIHIVSHGSPGTLYLGASTLSADNIERYQSQLQAWQASLAEGADILIYGCNAAAGESGQQFARQLGELTGADIGASMDETGGTPQANWSMEFVWGKVETGLFGDAVLLGQYEGRLDAAALAGNTGWSPLLYGTRQDPAGDMQAAAASTDIVGDGEHATLYFQYDNGGSISDETNDTLSFRFRVTGPNSQGGFGAVGLLGLDANLDGDLDIFLGVDDRQGQAYVTLFNPGSGSNLSPNTTSITPAPGRAYATTDATYRFVAVNAGTDQEWDGQNDLDGGGKIDHFVSFSLSFNELKQELERDNVAGNPTAGITIDRFTPMRYVLMTMTQNNSINGDIGGIVGGNSSNQTFDQLGAFSPIVSASNSNPIISSGGGGATASYVIAEAETLVTQLTAQDMDAGDTLRWGIVGGADAGKFTIDTVTGQLSFVSGQSAAAPADADGDGRYEVKVRVLDYTDAGATQAKGGADTQDITVTVLGEADTSRPTLHLGTGISPVDGASGVAPNANLFLTFSENIQAGSGNILIRNATTGAIVQTIAVTDTDQVRFAGNRATINPLNDLAANTAYYIEIQPGAFKDMAGNAFVALDATTSNPILTGADPAGVNDTDPGPSYKWNFTTGSNSLSDSTFPTLTSATVTNTSGSSVALDNQTSVDIGSNIVLNFSEPIYADAGFITIRESATGNVLAQVSVTDASQVTISGNTVTLNPSVQLAPGVAYNVQIGAQALQDAAGNHYAGVTELNQGSVSSYALNFTTGSDTTAPVVTQVSASNLDGTWVAGDTIYIRVKFNEVVTVAGGTPTLQLETGSTDRNATYVSGSGSNTLIFAYTVQPQDTTADLNYLSTGALSLNGATIQDASSNNASLTLPGLAAGDSLGGQKNLVIDAAPVNALPGTQSAVVGIPLVFNSTNGNLISISDVDSALSPTYTVTLSATNGTVSLGGVSGLSFSAGDGTADSTVTFSGSLANVNAALNGMSFTGTSAASGSLQIVTRDGQTSVNGTVVQDSDSFAINVSAAVAPVLGGTGTITGYTENAAPVAINPLITVTDPDSGTLASATVALGSSYVAGDTLSLAANPETMGNIAGVYNGSGTLTLTSSGGTATLAQWQAALAAVAYSTTSDAPVTTPRSVSFTVSDAEAHASNAVNATVNVTPVNDAPVLGDASRTLSATQNARTPTGAVGTLVSDAIFTGGITDPDSGAALKGIAIVGSNEAQGTWYYSTNAGSTWNVVGNVDATQALLLKSDADTRLYFKPALNFDATATAALTIRAWDQSTGTAGSKVSMSTTGGTSAFSVATDTIDVSVTPNAAPVLNAAEVLSMSVEGGSGAPSGVVGVSVSTFIVNNNITDADAGAVKGLALIESNEASGTWWYSTNSGTSWTQVGTISGAQSLLLANDSSNRLYFQPATGYDGTVSTALTVRAWDQTSGDVGTKVSTASNGGSTAFSTMTDSIAVTVNPANSAPVLADATLRLTVAEDAGAPANGSAVGSLVSNFLGGVTDANAGASSGLVITGKVETNGTWYYTTNGGTTWQAVGTIDASNNLLLANDANTRLYFAPDSNYNGTATADLTIRAWDQTGGTAGQVGTKVSISGTGGITPYSAATDTIDVVVTPVNDAPVRTAGSVSNLTVNEDAYNATGVSLGLGTVAYGPGGGSDESGQTLTYTVTALPGAAVGTVYLNDGTTPVTINTSYTLSQIQGMVFKTTANGNGSGTFSYTVTDNGSTNGVSDPRSLTESLTVTVNSVNDAPTGANKTVTVTTTAGSIVQFAKADFGFADASDSPADTLSQISIESVPSRGTLAYWDGSAWTNITTASAGSPVIVTVTNGDFLRWTAAGTGSNPTFAFRVIDDGGTANGGSNIDATQRTMTLSTTSGAAPVLAGTGSSISFTEALTGSSSTAVRFDSGMTVTDSNNPASFSTGNLTVGYTADGTSTDELSVIPVNTGTNRIRLTGSTVEVSTNSGGAWTSIGTIDTTNNGTAGKPLTITFNTGATIARTNVLLQNIGYRNTSDAPSETTRTVGFRLTDNTAKASTVRQYTVGVTAVNDAPVLNDTALTLTVAEDAGAPVNGTAVGSLISAYTGGVTDVDGASAAKGIVLVGSTETNGTWYYTTNGGSSWSAVGTVSATSGLLLADNADTRLYFAPNANYNNSTAFSGLTLRAWDQTGSTAGQAGTKVNVSTLGTGGTTPFSSATDTVAVTVSAVNDAPVATGSASLTAITQGASNPAGATVSSLFGSNFSDTSDTVSGGSTANSFAGVAIVSNLANASTEGKWQYNTGSGWTDLPNVNSVAAAFTLRSTDQLRFLPVAAFSGTAPALTVKVIDGSTTVTAAATVDVSVSGGTTAYSAANVVLSHSVTDVNAAPSLAATAVNPTYVEGSASPVDLFSGVAISANDPGQTINSLKLTVAGLANGSNEKLTIDGTEFALTNGTSGTAGAGYSYSVSVVGSTATVTITRPSGNMTETAARNIVDGLGYRNTSTAPTGATRTVTLTEVVDSGASANTTPLSLASTVSLQFTNDAPVLAETTLAALSIGEDAGAPVNGSTVGSILVSSLTGGISDADASPQQGIAISAADQSHGTWYYSTNGGTSWTAVGTVNASQSLLLANDASTRLYFAPTGNFNGSVSNALTFRAWDRSDGLSAGTTTSTAVTGGSSAFSNGTDSIDVTVTAVADAPTRTAASVNLASVSEDVASPAGSTVNVLFASAFSDAADNQTASGGSSANSFAGVVIVANNANAGTEGQWQWFNGTSWIDIGNSVSTSNALVLSPGTSVRFVPVADFNGTPGALTARLVDSSGGALTSGNLVNVTTSGGTTPYSDASNAVSLTTSISAVNDAPIATGSATLAAITEDTGSPAGDTITNLFGANFSDTADQVTGGTGGTSANTLAGVAIVAYTRDASKGEWQYFNGSSWTTISSSISSAANALTVGVADKLRFVPTADYNGPAPSMTVKLVDSSRTVSTGATFDASTDGGSTAFSSATVILAHSVTAVNDAPVGQDAIVWVAKNGSYTLGLSDFAYTDPNDSPANALLAVKITGLPAPAAGTLLYNNGSWVAVTLNQSISVADITAGKLKFEPVSNETGLGLTNILFRVQDNGGTANGGSDTDATDRSIVFNVGSQLPPVISGGSIFEYSETGTASIVNPNISVYDADNATLESGTVTVSRGFVLGQDLLAFTNDNATTYGNITATWDAANGVLNMSSAGGTATQAQWQAAFRAVTYTNLSDAPSSITRVVSFAVNDGTSDSNVVQSTMDLQPINDAPDIGGASSTLTYYENATAQVINAGITIVDVDNPTSFNGGFLQVNLTANAAAEDQLTVLSSTSGTNRIQLSGSNVQFSSDSGGTWTTIGTVDGTLNGQNGASLRINLNADSSPAAVQLLAQRIAYANTSEAPSTLTRSVSFTINDGGNVGSGGPLADTRTGDTVAVVAVNDAPTGASGSLALQTNSNYVFVQADFGFSDPVEGNNFSGVIITSFSGVGELQYNSGTWTAVSANAVISAADIAAGKLRYAGGVTPGSGSFTFQVQDDGGTTNGGDDTDSDKTMSLTVTAGPVPVLGGVSDHAFTENQAAFAIFPSLTVTHGGAPATYITEASFTVSAGYADGDLLAFTTLGTISASWNSGSGELTLTSSSPASLADWQAALRTVTYVNTSDAPSTIDRTVTLRLTDSVSETGLPARSTISVTALNDAPILTAASPALASITEDQTANAGQTVASFMGTITDPDGASVVKGIAITGASVSSGSGTWQYSLDGSTWNNVSASSSAALLLRPQDFVRFVPDGLNASTGTFTYRAWDQTTGSAGSSADVGSIGTGGTTAFSTQQNTVTIAATAVNDAPVLDDTKTPLLVSVGEDAGAPSGAVGTLVSSLVDFASPAGQVDNVTDVDGTVPGVAITATNTANGTWFYSTNGGSTWTSVGAVADTSALLLAADANTRLYFQSNATDFNGTVSNAITFRAWDQSTGTAGTKVSTAINGGISAFSSATDTADVTVNAVVDIAADTASTNEDTALVISAASLVANDNFEGTPVVTAVGGAVNGTVSLSSGTITFTPTAQYNGPASFTYTVTSGGVTETATVNVTVDAINHAPTADNPEREFTTTAGTPIPLDPLGGGWFEDRDGDTLTLQAGVPAHGAVISNSDGTFSYVPDEGFAGTDTFTVVARDPSGASTVCTITVVVRPVTATEPTVPVSTPTAPVVPVVTPPQTSTPAATINTGVFTGGSPVSSTLNSLGGTSSTESGTPGITVPPGGITGGLVGTPGTTAAGTPAPTPTAPTPSAATPNAPATGTQAPGGFDQINQLPATGAGVAGGTEGVTRGFPVVTVGDIGQGNGQLADNQGTGDERLFVFEGIQNTQSRSADTLDLVVPREAFGHTNPSAVISLEATLADGAPLPGWIQFDNTSGSFVGVPPSAVDADIDIKVTARDDSGRQAELIFRPIIASLNADTPATTGNAGIPAATTPVAGALANTGGTAGLGGTTGLAGVGTAGSSPTSAGVQVPGGVDQINQLPATGAGGTEGVTRGFPVAAVGDAGQGNDQLTGNQGTGDERLFVFEGIQNTQSRAADALDLVVPREAFGHTNPSAMISLEATLADGAPLPGWIQFDNANGSFTGVPPSAADADIDIKVTARDEAGRQAELIFRPIIASLNADTPATTADAGTPAAATPVGGAVANTGGTAGLGGTTGSAVTGTAGTSAITAGGSGAPAAGTTTGAGAGGNAGTPADANAAAGTPQQVTGDRVGDGGFPLERIGSNTSAPGAGAAAGVPAAVAAGGEAADGAASTGAARLFVYQGVQAAPSESAEKFEFHIPRNAFAHTDSTAVVRLEATLVDGSKLPEWLNFNGQTGALTGLPPDGQPLEIEIKITARDEVGREASVVFAPVIAPAGAAGIAPAAAEAGQQAPNAAVPNRPAPGSASLEPGVEQKLVSAGTLNSGDGTASGLKIASAEGISAESLKEAGGFPVARVDTGGVVQANASESGADTHRLFVYQGIADLSFAASGPINFTVPMDAFAHTDSGATVVLNAYLADGSSLPTWLSFNPLTGAFSGMAPQDSRGHLDIEIVARDELGRIARVQFKLDLDPVGVEAAPVRQAEPPAPAEVAEAGYDKDAKEAEEAEQEARRIAQADKEGEAVSKAKAEFDKLKRMALPFSEQAQMAKVVRDPLLARILAGQSAEKAADKATKLAKPVA